MRNHSLLMTTLLIMGSIFLISFKVNSQTCPTGMVAYLKLEEKSGSTFEDSYGSHDAAITASPTAVKGRADVGMGQSFNGSKVDIPADAAFNWGSAPNFTIEFWMKSIDAVGTKVMIGSKGAASSWWIGMDAGVLTWEMNPVSGSSQVLSSSVVNDGTWKHIVCIKSGVSSKIYINGTIATSGNSSFSGNIGTGAPINIGYWNLSPYYQYVGALDEIAIYGSALAEATITEHYANGNSTNGYGIGYCDGDASMIVTSPDEEATIGNQYTYDVDASGNPKPTYELVSGPSGMTINPTTGIITWTPSSVSDNGQVTVKATNTGGTDEQSFNIYLASTPVCKSNLDAYWSFDDNSSSYLVDDIIGYTMTGYSSYTSGVLDGARNFNGSSDSLRLQDPEGGTESFFDFSNGAGEARDFSIEYWMKTDATPDNGGIGVHIGRIEPENATYYWMGINTSGQIQGEFHDYSAASSELSITASSDLRDGSWHHIIFTHSASADEMNIYVDGVAEATESKSFLDFGGNDPLTIGWFDLDPRYFFEGALDELTFYNKTLSSTEVASNYNSGNPTATCQYNYAPAFTSPAVTDGTEETAYTYNITVNDVDGDQVTISDISSPALPSWLTFTYSGPGAKVATLAGTPPTDFYGIVNVTLRVSDGTVNVDQDFTITFANVNDAPVITSTAVTGSSQDVEYTYTVTATDADSDPLTFVGVTIPSWLTFTPATGVLTGTPGQSDIGDNQAVLITVDDGNVATPVQHSFSINVGDVNDKPVISANKTLNTNEDTPISLKLSDFTVTDPDNTTDQITLVVVDGDYYSISGTTVTPDENYEDDITITVKARDIYGAESDPYNFTLGITPVNDAPVITSVAVTAATEDMPYGYLVTAEDPDAGSTLTYSAPTLPSWLTFNAVAKTLGGTPTNNQVGDHNVTIRVSDGILYSDQSFTITVTNVNDAPYFTSEAVTTGDDYEEYSYAVVATDDDAGDIVTLTAPTKPSWATFSNGTLAGTPASGDALKDFSVVIRATDKAGSTSEQSFSIYVGNTNSKPVITSTPDESVIEGSQYKYILTATDEDEDDELVYTAEDIPTWLKFKAGVLSGTPSNANVGINYDVILKVSDGRDDVYDIFSIAVTNIPEAPEITSVPDSFKVHQGNTWGYTVIATDPDPNDDLTYTATVKPDWLNFNALTHKFEGTPSNTYANASYDVVIEVEDENGLKDSQPFSIEVINVNDAPKITSTQGNVIVKEDAPFSYKLVVEDIDQLIDQTEVLTYSATTLPDWMEFDAQNAILTGTPDDGDEGDHDVVLSVSDGKADAVTQSFTITVDPVNDAPELTGFNPLELDLAKESEITIEMSGLFIDDPDNDISEITLTVLPGSENNYIVNGNTIKPVSSFTSGTLNVKIKLDDGTDETEATITVSVITDISENFTTKLVSKAYPNPADNEVYLKFNQLVNDVSVVFYDISGKQVKEFEFGQIHDKALLDISEFKSGIYMYKVLVGNKVQIGRLTVK